MQLLINSLNMLYQPPITYTGNSATDTQNLRRNLTNLTLVQFNSAYAYPYLGDSSDPPQCSDTSTIRSNTDFSNANVNNPTAITNYIVQNIIPNGVPTVYTRQAASDLSAAILNDSGQSPGQGWQCQAFHRVYTDVTGKTPNFAIDAEFTWTVANAVDPSQQPPSLSPMLFLQYVSVVYATKGINFDEPNTPGKPVHLPGDNGIKEA